MHIWLLQFRCTHLAFHHHFLKFAQKWEATCLHTIQHPLLFIAPTQFPPSQHNTVLLHLKFQKVFFYMCKFCKSVPIPWYVRSLTSHMLKTGRIHHRVVMKHQNQPGSQNPLPSNERSQKMACSSHWNKVMPKKHQTFFPPNLNADSFTSTITALLNR